MYIKKLEPNVDLNEYFSDNNFKILKLGNLNITSGKIIVSDPLYSLPYAGTDKFEKTVKKGSFPVVVAVFEDKKNGPIYMASKLSFSKAQPVKFQLALKANEDYTKLNEDEIYGYPVQTGLASFCDAKAQIDYQVFCNEVKKKYRNPNIYETYFARAFEENGKNNPKWQSPQGDWLNFNIPNSKYNIVMMNSGVENGVYPSYWGYDEYGEICCLITPFVSISEIV